MLYPELEEIVNNRKDFVKVARKNKYDFSDILVGLYNDVSHFIYELIQNAEDKGATEISFDLFPDRLEVIHNGEIFNLKDIEGITGIGIKVKKDQINAIGKFGVGFKSVFAITQSPIIKSGKYYFTIKDFVLPDFFNTETYFEKTKIILPFNHSSRVPKEIYDLIAAKLENIGINTLLFLSNINEIVWQSIEQKGSYSKTTELFKDIENTKKVNCISVNNGHERSEQYIVIYSPFNSESNNLKIEIAFKLGQDKVGKEIIVPVIDPKLIVFFPTEKITYLKFHIQGPYKTTPSRENIPLNDEQNKNIIKKTGELISESLSIIKRLNLLDINFLNVLPISDDHPESMIYRSFYNVIKLKFQSKEELLPTNNNGYTSSKDSILADSKELTDFLSNNDIKTLFNKSCWLDINISSERNRELRFFIVNTLAVPEISFKYFADKITKDFLVTKNDEWVSNFYSKLIDQPSLWREKSYNYSAGILRNKPIIRLNNDEHVTPFEGNGKIQVYLPSDSTSPYKTVKKILTEKEDSLKFLTLLGLSKPDIFAEIKEFIIPQFQEETIQIEDDKYYEDFKKIFDAYCSLSSDRRYKFIDEIKGIPFLKSFNPVSTSVLFKKPSEIYISSEYLIEYFKDYGTVFFIVADYYKKFDRDKLENFLLNLGCNIQPRRLAIPLVLSNEEKFALRKEQNYSPNCTREEKSNDYDYEGLNNYLSQINLLRSQILWRLLLGSIKYYNDRNKSHFFKGDYNWFYRSLQNAYFDAKFLNTLRATSWLVDRNNLLMKPSEVALSDLHDGYKIEDENITFLIKALNVKPDEIKIIEEKTGGKFIPKEEIEEYRKWKGEQVLSIKHKGEIESWEPVVEPNSINTPIIDVKPETILSPNLKNQILSINAIIPNNLSNENIGADSKKDIDSKDDFIKDNKKKGKWGEEKVLNALINEYSINYSIEETSNGFKAFKLGSSYFEINWLNKHKEIGKGYDFVITHSDIEIEYIEVKSKSSEYSEWIFFQGTQWEFARKLFNEGEGDKYCIYLVTNVGNPEAKIKKYKNPIKLWQEGKIIAHPINLKL